MLDDEFRKIEILDAAQIGQVLTLPRWLKRGGSFALNTANAPAELQTTEVTNLESFNS